MKQVLNQLKKLYRYEHMIPDKLINSQEKKVLHISDTPTQIYNHLIAVINKIQPDVIIHTGDVADEFKIGEDSVQSPRYQELVVSFIERMSEITKNIIIVPGNHDSQATLTNLTDYITLIKPNELLSISQFNFTLSHSLDQLSLQDADFYLYGHNFDVPVSGRSQLFINGVKNINVILLPSGRVITFPYPRDTDYHRKYSRPMKLL